MVVVVALDDSKTPLTPAALLLLLLLQVVVASVKGVNVADNDVVVGVIAAAAVLDTSASVASVSVAAGVFETAVCVLSFFPIAGGRCFDFLVCKKARRTDFRLARYENR